ncbi:MAG: hypothetical protein PVI40_03805 [Chlamydiota bacterium]|jgi:hypothetical protein
MNVLKITNDIKQVSEKIAVGMSLGFASVHIYNLATRLLLGLSEQNMAWGVSSAIALVNSDKYIGFILLSLTVTIVSEMTYLALKTIMQVGELLE